ncbi:hypothetical protein Tco_0865233 [Tanacetum coccineum]
MILLTSSTNLHSTNTRHTRVSFVEGTLTRVLIVKQGTRPSLIRVPITIKTLILTNLHSILRVSHNSSTVVSSVEVHIIVMIAKAGNMPLAMIRENNRILEEMLRTQMPNSPVVLNEPEGSDDYTELPWSHRHPLMVYEVISTYFPDLGKLRDEFIKSSIDDFVPIPRESEVTSDSVLEFDMPATTPLPPTDNGEADFDINSPLGEYVVDFLMKNEDVAGLPRHLVKYLF